MSQPVRVCVVGSANVDLTFRAPRMPRLGETLIGSGFTRSFGGKGANQAVAAARQGAHVVFVACVGADPFGVEFLRKLANDGLNIDHVRSTAELPTGVAGIVVDDSAENCIIVVGGANALLSPEDVQAALPAIAKSNVLVCQLETPLPTIEEALRVARENGVRTVLNPAPAASLSERVLRLVDLLVPNQTELESLSDGYETPEAAARKLLDRGVGAVAVTLGDRGALLVESHGTQIIPAMNVKAVDPTGAGDAFTAALAVRWAEGLPLRDAARFAAIAAAITVTRSGTIRAFPTRAETVGQAESIKA